jgi:hypothetical protein
MTDWGNIYAVDNGADYESRIRRLERGRQTFRRGTLVTPSSDYAATPSDLLTSDGRIDLSGDAGLEVRGPIAPFGVQGSFGFAGTDTTITIYWDGTHMSDLLCLIRANGEVVHIPSGSKTITGLSASTTYAFLPYWSVFNECGIGFIVGDVGIPKFAFTAAAMDVFAASKQSLMGREQLSPGFITYTTAGGGGTIGPGGAVGGGGRCVMLGTDIEALGGYECATKHYPNNDWIRIKAGGRILNCTPDHPLYHADKGKIRADQFALGDWVITDNGEREIVELEPFIRVCTKVEVVMESGHLFWANGFLSHNLKDIDPDAS